ncbi:MAG TPA: alpha/beta hydrolase [Gaiellaceae bacterium]|nr:alpha/beta hydrolase [Gaiellaceae bacterium]
MPNATNALDGRSVYYEDDGGPGTPVVLYGGILDSVELVRASHIASALQDLPGEFRLIYADHRGLGRSDKPHDVAAYAMSLQTADVVALLDALSVDRAHFVGRSYGGRLAFGVGEHAPERVLSLVAGGQQPYAMNPDGPLARVVAAACDATRREGARAFVEALEDYWEIRFPDPERGEYVAQDGAALAAAAEAMLTQGAISEDLTKWRVPCLIYLGSGDVDFVEQAQRAAEEIPNASIITLDDLDHYGAHFEAERVTPAVLQHLRENG